LAANSSTFEKLDNTKEFIGLGILQECCREAGVTYGRNNLRRYCREGIIKIRQMPNNRYIYTKKELGEILEIMRGLK